MSEPDVLTVDEAAKRMRVSRMTAYRAVWDGLIPHHRINGRILIPRKQFERWLAKGSPDGFTPFSVRRK
jgi:excisionase family DNA binding protein